MSYDAEREGPALIFDGVCSLCNASVDFIVRHESEPVLRFIPWQSPLGEAVLRELGLWTDPPDALVLLVGREALRGSDAALEACRWLRFPWRPLRVLRVVPRFLREPVYRGIARVRYRWFGRLERCRVPGPELQARFREHEGPASAAPTSPGSHG